MCYTLIGKLSYCICICTNGFKTQPVSAAEKRNTEEFACYIFVAMDSSLNPHLC